VVPASLPSIADDREPIGRAEAENRLGRSLAGLDGSALGTPAGYAEAIEGGVLVVWPDSTTLWIHRAETDLAGLLHKQLPDGATLEPVEDLGDRALVVAGSHVLRTPHRTVAAGTTVLWVSGEWELRLESDRDRAELIDVARELDRSAEGGS
jgi:hypothetical protein